VSEPPLRRLSLAELSSAIRERRRRAEGLMREALDAAQRIPGAFVSCNPEQALEAAATLDGVLDAGGVRGPLAGLPWSAKDLFGVEGYPTFAGTPRRFGGVFETDGPLVARLRAAGALCAGKTHTVEFAFGGVGTNPHWPAPQNPWDLRTARVPGGSSSGAGVAVAAGASSFALGTDTAGSVRIPAAFNGVVGFKTTKGHWSTEGVVPLSPTLDTPGVLAASVADVARVAAVLDGGERPIEARRDAPVLARPSNFFWDETDPEVARVIEASVAELERAGARVVDRPLPGAEEAFELFAGGGPVSAELAAFLDAEAPDVWGTLDPHVAARADSGRSLLATDYLLRLAAMERLARDAAAAFGEIDLFVAPTTPGPAPAFAEVESDEGYRTHNLLALRHTSVVSYLGLTAASLPAGLVPPGLPVGLQLIAPGGEDARLLSCALWAERVLGAPRERIGVPAT
jgi:aspartyl-tRNA(Asn)/glutamyl-tRNA(Gln) amidotransferase subunit A